MTFPLAKVSIDYIYWNIFRNEQFEEWKSKEEEEWEGEGKGENSENDWSGKCDPLCRLSLKLAMTI